MNNKVAFVYDFDGTLIPGSMQEYAFIPSVGKTRDTFWKEVDDLANKNNADNILAYMYHMLDCAKGKVSVHKQDITKCGKNIKFFNGVEDWFSRINNYAKTKQLAIEHYIVSSGIKEIIEGTKIHKNFSEIFASSFMYSENDVANWPAQALNYTTKTQYLFRINKGSFDINDSKEINQYIPDDERYIPFSRIIYFGDGFTDVPCMKLTKVNGGYSIAVYKPSTNKKNAVKLKEEGRVDFIAPADYSENKSLDKITKKILDKISTDISLDNLKKL